MARNLSRLRLHATMNFSQITLLASWLLYIAIVQIILYGFWACPEIFLNFCSFRVSFPWSIQVWARIVQFIVTRYDAMALSLISLLPQPGAQVRFSRFYLWRLQLRSPTHMNQLRPWTRESSQFHSSCGFEREIILKLNRYNSMKVTKE